MRTLAKLGLIIIFYFVAGNSYGQGPGFGDDVDDTTTNAPLDGGLSLLIAAGVGYGAKRVHEHNRKKKKEAGSSEEEKY